MLGKSKTINHSEVMEQYKQIREIAQKLYNEVLPKYLPKEAFLTCGKKLGIMHKNTLVLSDMDQMPVLMDYSIYEYRENGKNAVARYLAETRLEPGSEEDRVVKAMSDSFYTLVQVEEVLPKIGAQVHDLLRDERFLLVDINLSQTAVPGAVIATRILPFNAFVITSGAPLAVNAEILSKIRTMLIQHIEDERNGRNNAHARTNLATTVIRMCLGEKSSTKIKYRDVDIQSVESPLRRDARVGRNDPCPCGSGRKYKRCCGTLAPL